MLLQETVVLRDCIQSCRAAKCMGRAKAHSAELKVQLRKTNETYRMKVEQMLQHNSMSTSTTGLTTLLLVLDDAILYLLQGSLTPGQGELCCEDHDCFTVLKEMSVDSHLVTQVMDFVMWRPQYVRLRACSSETGAPQGTVFFPCLGQSLYF